LRERGLDTSQIDAMTMNQAARPVLRTTAIPASPKNTIAAGALAGAIAGGIFGLIFDAFFWLAPQLVGWVTIGPWSFVISTIIIGAVFGVVFGFFIGQNKREDDLSVTADGLVNGEYLVAAYPQPQQEAMVEDVLQIYHARELNR
jgi:uncharacterized protein YcfJ